MKLGDGFKARKIRTELDDIVLYVVGEPLLAFY